MFLANVSLMFRDVDQLSDEEAPAQKKEKSKKQQQAVGNEENQQGQPKAKAEPKKGGKGRGKGRGKGSHPKNTPKVKPAPKKRPAAAKVQEKDQTQGSTQVQEHADEETPIEEGDSKRPRASALKKPAARPSASGASEKPLSIYKYQYQNGTYGFKTNVPPQSEIMRVGALKAIGPKLSNM